MEIPDGQPQTTTAHVEVMTANRQLRPPTDHPESESELLYEWRFTANQFIFGAKPLEAHEQSSCFATEPLW
jgi:hypothetical protein